jgi:hypothetical protein
MTRQPEETLYDYIARLRRQGVRSTNAGPLVRSAMASPDELASALRAAFTQRDSALLSFMLEASLEVLDPALVPVLCDMLDSDVASIVEDTVEQLGLIADPAAVPCLTRILRSPPQWDFNGYAGEKAVWSLEAIGTPEAREAIRFAATTQRRRVWQATIRPLEQDHNRLLELAHRLVAEDPWSYHLERLLPILAKSDTPEDWRIIELVAESEDDDNRTIAQSLLHARGQASPTGEGGA